MAAPGWHHRIVVALLGTALTACGTVDLGDNFVAPAVQLDDDFFYCRIQPDVLTRHSCASGGSGEAGMCHSARSALRLVHLTVADLPLCDDEDKVLEPIPLAATDNLNAVLTTVQGTAQTSPLYLRPINRASHPRQVFPENDPAAELIVTWISQGER